MFCVSNVFLFVYCVFVVAFLGCVEYRSCVRVVFRKFSVDRMYA